MRRWFVSCVVALVALLLRAEAAGLSEVELKAARKLYEVKCAKCHKFYDPAPYPPAEWADWMGKMSRESRLKPEQDRILRAYIDEYRKSGKFPR